jgi:hypothetical protein
MRSIAGSENIDVHANSLLATTFNNPQEVLQNLILTTVEKRCVLAAWASDAFAVEGQPWHRQLPGSSSVIRRSDILAALRRLDDDEPPPDGPPKAP